MSIFAKITGSKRCTYTLWVVSLLLCGLVVYNLRYIINKRNEWTDNNSLHIRVSMEPVETTLPILDPYKVDDEPNAVCSPLVLAKNKENICVYRTSEDQYISRVINSKHVWESNIVSHLLSQFKKNPELQVLIDIGVNLGVHTLTVASHGIHVVGVEPYPPNLARLAKTLRLNPSLIPLVTIVPLGVSDKHERLIFQSVKQHPGGTKLHSEEDRQRLGQRIVKDLRVESITLDELIPLINYKRAILKMDIENGEYKALLGAKKLFATIDIPYVYMEWSKKHEVQEWRLFFIRFFKERNYTVHNVPQMEKLELTEDACKTWPFDVVFKKQYE